MSIFKNRNTLLFLTTFMFGFILSSFSFHTHAFGQNPWFTDQASIMYLISLKNAESVVTDDQSKEIIQSVIKNPDLRNDPEVSSKINTILKRVDFIVSFHFAKDKIKDEKTLQDIDKWIKDQVLLDDPDEQKKAQAILDRIELGEKLEKALEKISDDETKELVNSWLADLPLLDDLNVQIKAYTIINRLKLVEKLESIVDPEKELIQDDGTKELIQKWLDNQPLLDQDEAQEQAKNIINRIELFRLLKMVHERINNRKEKKLVDTWLNNQLLLDDEKVKEEVHKILLKVAQGPVMQRIRTYKTTKNLSIFGYTAYRKVAFLKALNSGVARGWFQKFIDWLATGSYLVGNVYELYLRACKNLSVGQQELPFGQKMFYLMPHLQEIMLAEKDGVMGLSPSFQYELNYWQDKARRMLKDDVSDAINGISKRVNKDDVLSDLIKDDRLRKSGNLKKHFENRIALGKAFNKRDNIILKEFLKEDGKLSKDKIEKITQKIEKVDKEISEKYKNTKDILKSSGASKEDIQKVLNNSRERKKEVNKITKEYVKENGFKGRELEFFDTFDSYLDRILESKVNKVLKTVKIPKALRYLFWKNDAVGFSRKMFLCKFLPTVGYWYLFERSDKNKEFTSHMMFKELVKSVDQALELEIMSQILYYLNGDIDDYGKGRLDRAKDKTCGLIGPNLAKFILRHTIPFGIVAGTNKLIKKDFLEIDDIHPAYPNKPKNLERYDKEKRDKKIDKWKKRRNGWFAKEVVGFAGKNVLAFYLVKLLKKIRPGIVQNAKTKTGNFLDFLVRRNWIDKTTRNVVGELGSSLFTKIAPFGAMMFLHRNAKMTDYDEADAWRDFSNTKDELVFVDYLLASAIGEKLSEMFAEWLIGKKLKGKTKFF